MNFDKKSNSIAGDDAVPLQANSYLNLVTACYLSEGGDFNGFCLSSLVENTGRTWSQLQQEVIALVLQGSVSVQWEGVAANPHINRTGFSSIEAQVGHLGQLKEAHYHTCLYPSRTHLSLVVPAQAYAGFPYTREIALGAAQLDFLSFDLQVLEIYRNDPRYYYNCSDIGGSLCISDDGLEGGSVRESDQVLIETFGFSYDDAGNRSVAVFLRYLRSLSSEHQLIWRARQLPERQKLHPDYYRSSVLGEWHQYIPLLQGICLEIWLINQMAIVIRGQPLFMRDYGKYGENRPKRLALLIRPTLEEFNASVLLLDKVLSDNISKDFFKGVISLETDHPRADGKIEVRRKGTIQMLDEYLRTIYNASDWTAWVEAINALKAVRKLRQSPAHSVKEDVFDLKYAHDFRDVCIKVYQALATLRDCLQSHPEVKKSDVEVPRELQEGKIWMA